MKIGAPYYVRALAMGIPAICLGLQITGWLFFFPAIRDGHADFRAFYSAGYMVRSGAAHQLYDYEVEKDYQDRLVSEESFAMPFIHPAYETLLFVPLSLLSYRKAYWVLLALNLALLIGCYRLLRPQMRALAGVWPLLPAAVFLFLPVASTLMQGQDSIVLLAALVGASVSLQKKREGLAGSLLALGLFRLQIVLPIALLFLLWRRWRFSAGFALTGIVLAIISAGVVGLEQTGAYVRTLWSMTGSGPVIDQFRYAQPDWQMANLRGLIVGLFGSHIPKIWTRAVIVLSSVLVLGLVARLNRKREGEEAFHIAVLASAVISFHLLFHDLVILLVPLVFALNRFLPSEESGDFAGQVVARTAAMTFAAPIALSFVPDFFYLVALAPLTFLFVLVGYFRTVSGGMCSNTAVARGGDR